jgi:uncharacterized protein
VSFLVIFNVTRAFGLLGPSLVSAAVLFVGVALIAWWTKASLADVGLDPANWRRGVAYGLAALMLVAVVLALAALIPATNDFLHDSRGRGTSGHLEYELGVSILLGTVIPEELAFRGVLLGSGLALWNKWRAVLIVSALFGLWHIAPTLHTSSDNSAVSGVSGSAGGQGLVVLGAVAVTFVAGFVFCWLRLRSDSLLAPVIAHFATNGLGLVAAWLAAR